ncbi:MAG: mercury resistance system transport protein MerF [Nitrospirota bacterium]
MFNNPSRCVRVGLTGSLVATVCCATPILVVVLTALGLGAITGYLDAVLLPLLGLFGGLTVYGLVLKRRRCS